MALHGRMTNHVTPWVEQPLEREFSAAVLDTIGALVCVIDREGRIVRFNRESERISGYTLAEVRDRPFWELLIPPEEVKGVKDVVRDLVVLRQPNAWENHWITKDGEQRLIRWSNTVLCEGDRLACLIGTGVDVTEERRATEAYDRLLEEERRARAAAERAERRAEFIAEAGPLMQSAVPDQAAVLDALARYAVPCLADWCAVRLVGEDGMARTAAFAHVDPAIAERVRALDVVPVWTGGGLPPIVAHGVPVVANGAAAAEALRTAGEALPPAQAARAREALRIAGLSSFMAVPLAVRGRMLGAILFVYARPDRTYGAEDLVLAQALAVRAALAVDNARLTLEAQRALSAREDFLAVASHELRTPLATLQLAVQALLAHGNPPWGAPLLGAVARATGRLNDLVEDILDISRLAAGPPAPDCQEVDLGALVAEVVGASAELLQRAGCTARTEMRGPCTGSWDPRWLRRVVLHLVANAAKYGAGQPVEIDVEGGAEAVRLTVRDHGIGIPAEEQARIFECFERAVPVHHYGGLGLGLWLVRQMVRGHGGEVRVESCPGEGATFTVDLPKQVRAAGERLAA
jgi:PAS domain S-box-containing protein